MELYLGSWNLTIFETCHHFIGKSMENRFWIFQRNTYPPVIKRGVLETSPFIDDFSMTPLAPTDWRRLWNLDFSRLSTGCQPKKNHWFHGTYARLCKKRHTSHLRCSNKWVYCNVMIGIYYNITSQLIFPYAYVM